MKAYVIKILIYEYIAKNKRQVSILLIAFYKANGDKV